MLRIDFQLHNVCQAIRGHVNLAMLRRVAVIEGPGYQVLGHNSVVLTFLYKLLLLF